MTINLSIPKQYHTFLVEEKAETGKTFSEIIRCALDVYRKAKLEQQPK